MSIFKSFSASKKAVELSNIIGKVWKDTVNFICFKGVNLELVDSGYLLSLVFSIVFLLGITQKKIDKEKMNMIGYLIKKNMKSILRSVWSRQINNDEILEEFIDKVTCQFDSTFKNFFDDYQNTDEFEEIALQPNRDKSINFMIKFYMDAIQWWYDELIIEHDDIKKLTQKI